MLESEFSGCGITNHRAPCPGYSRCMGDPVRRFCRCFFPQIALMQPWGKKSTPIVNNSLDCLGFFWGSTKLPPVGPGSVPGGDPSQDWCLLQIWLSKELNNPNANILMENLFSQRPHACSVTPSQAPNTRSCILVVSCLNVAGNIICIVGTRSPH